MDHVVLGMYYECRNETAFLRVEGESRNVKGLIMRGRHSNRCGPKIVFTNLNAILGISTLS